MGIQYLARDIYNLALRLQRALGYAKKMNLAVSDVIQPTFEMNEAAWGDTEWGTTTLNLYTTAGSVIYSTTLGEVPQGQTWKIVQAYRSAVSTAVPIAIVRAGSAVTSYVRLSDTITGEAFYDGVSRDLILNAGDKIGVVSNNQSGDNAITFEIIFKRRISG